MRVSVRTPPLVAACLFALTLGVSGCSVFESVPEPDGAAEAVAGDLADGSVEAAFGSAQAQREYDAIVAGLGEEATPEVTLVEAATTDEEETEAVATLRWTWPLGLGVGAGPGSGPGSGEWSYESELTLGREGEVWRPVWDPAVVEPSLAEGEVLATEGLAATRGRILGDRGRVLVGLRPVVRFGIDRGQVPAAAAGRSARGLARLVGIDVAPYARRVTAAGERAFVEAIVFRQEEVPDRVAAAYEQIPGALAVPAERPLAPTREFAAPILGVVGEVTAEILEAEPGAYRVGDLVGLSGLQARYEEQLRGVPGLVVRAATPGGDAGDSSSGAAGEAEPRELFRVEPEAGEDLRLTLSPRLQTAAESVLAAVPSARGEPAQGPSPQERSASALVAVRPSDGAILAAANGAGSDGLNLATFGQFAPGSTFKIVSALALLRAGLTPDSSIECPSTVVVDGRPFGNYDDYPFGGVGTIKLRTALASSCNTAFINGRARLGRGDLASAAGRSAWGSTTTSGSRRTSARSRHRRRRRRRRPT